MADSAKIERISREGGYDRYVKKLDCYTHLVALLCGALMHFGTLREISIGMLSETNNLQRLGGEQLPDTMSYGVSIPKLNDNIPNEDSFCKSDNLIAVSDGAGGCGLFAREWSKYLLRHIPRKRAITSFVEFDAWVDGIWEAFYNEYETVAKAGDGIFLNKFYNEGACATVAAAWRVSDEECRWVAYGDSVVFHYNRKSKSLEHSFTRLADFSRPPMLVSCKDPLVEEGFRCVAFWMWMI